MAYGTGHVGLYVVALVFQLGAHAMYLATWKVLKINLTGIGRKIAGFDGVDIAYDLFGEFIVVVCTCHYYTTQSHRSCHVRNYGSVDVELENVWYFHLAFWVEYRYAFLQLRVVDVCAAGAGQLVLVFQDVAGFYVGNADVSYAVVVVYSLVLNICGW